jgi:hypothetical protein
LPKAPPGFDSRDRIPLLARKGEYVATPEMDKRNPGLFGLLERLRRGARLGRSLLGYAPDFRAPRLGHVKAKSISGMALGGSVGEGVVTDPGRNEQTQASVVYTPVVFTDSREFRRALASNADVLRAATASSPFSSQR